MKRKKPNDVLTEMQLKFINNYLSNGKNGYKAAIDAGYSPNSAKSVAKDLINNHPIVSTIISVADAYIETRKEEMYLEAKMRAENDRKEKERHEIAIMTGTEVMQTLSEVARGNVNDQFDLPPTLKDRLDAMKEVAKRTIDLQIKLDEAKKQNPDITINIIKREKKEQGENNGSDV